MPTPHTSHSIWPSHCLRALVLAVVFVMGVGLLLIATFDWAGYAVAVRHGGRGQSAMMDKDRGVSGPYYYVVDHALGDSSAREHRFYKLTPQLHSNDQLLGSVRGPYGVVSAFASAAPTTVLLIKEDGWGGLYAVDVAAEITPRLLMSTPLKRRIARAQLVNDRHLLIITDATTPDRYQDQMVDATVHLVSLATGVVEKEVHLGAIVGGVYSGWNIVGYNPANNTVLLVHGGGDGGGGWSRNYLVRFDTGDVTPLNQWQTNQGDQMGERLYDVSPNGSMAVGIVSPAYDEADLDRDQFPGCLKRFDDYATVGEQIIVRNLSTGESRILYTNLGHSDNFCHNLIRKIYGVQWVNDRELVYVAPDGVYALDVLTGERSAIRSTFIQNPLGLPWQSLSAATDRYVVLNGSELIDRRSGKSLQLPIIPTTQREF